MYGWGGGGGNAARGNWNKRGDFGGRGQPPKKVDASSFKRSIRLLRYALPHWRSLAVIIATMLVNVGLNVLRPWPIKLLVDNVLGHQPLPGLLHRVLVLLPGGTDRQSLLVWVSVAVVLLSLLGALVSMVSGLASTIFGQRITYDLAADLFNHVQRLSLLFHSRQPTGDTIARVTGDTYSVQTLITGVIVPVLQSIITVVTMFAIMWRLSPPLTLVSLGVTPFLGLSMQIFGGRMKSRTRARRDLEGSMMSVVQQTLSAVPAVQAFGREEIEDARFRATAADTVHAYWRATMANNWFSLVVGFLTAFGTAALMFGGGWFALHGTLTTGTIVLFLFYLMSLYQPLGQLAYTASTYQTAAAQGDRVLEFLEMPREIQDKPDAQDIELQGAIRYEDARFGYEVDHPVLKGISLQASPGEVVAIVGPTGAGKTTLVGLLLRFFDPWSGTVTIDRHDIRDLSLRSLRRQVAIVLQDAYIFPYTIAENIAYGRPDATREDIVAAAVAASADDFIRRLPEGYDTVVGERGTTLSGGEKQRLAIARAFLKDAPILILDEPTSALDARTEGHLLSSLERLMSGRTTIVIAHRLSTIRKADWILVMDNGEIVEQGSHADLIALQDGLYAGMYHQQMDIAQHEIAPQEVGLEA